ncbi:hypothetical protein KI387_036871, partial [Taxus chinensis]
TPYIVDESEDTPVVQLSMLEVASSIFVLKASALICRFNGFWPQTEALHKWIHSTWASAYEIQLCAKGSFIVQFSSPVDY